VCFRQIAVIFCSISGEAASGSGNTECVDDPETHKLRGTAIRASFHDNTVICSDAPDIWPDNPAFFISGTVSGRIPDCTTGYPVRPDTGYPANF
jgi:hypothetical protein